MKVIRARTSFDPAPTKTGNPDPDNLAPRRISRASSSSSNRVTVGSPRRASAARTCWGEARNSLRSITTLLLRESGLETAVAAILVDQSLHIQPTCRRVHDQHPQLGVERHRRAEQT